MWYHVWCGAPPNQFWPPTLGQTDVVLDFFLELKLAREFFIFWHFLLFEYSTYELISFFCKALGLTKTVYLCRGEVVA